MRTISAALLATQQDTDVIPHIHIKIDGNDISNRLLFIEHSEEPYREQAVLILNNWDRFFDAYDWTGKWFQIAYGHYTGNNVAEPNGDGAGNEYSYAPDLWVKRQQVISSEGEVLCQIVAEGMWAYLREKKIMGLGTAPYYNYDWTSTTPYAISEAIIETALVWTLNPLATSDSIIDVAIDFSINETPYESAAVILYRLAWMCKQYLRTKANLIMEWVYPQSTDAVQETYYSYQVPFFKEYAESINLTVPNSIAVYANQSADGSWTGLITGTASDAAQIAKYTEVLEPFLAGNLTTQGQADARAASILSKVLAEQLGGRLVIRHDARVELYDKESIIDRRGY